MPNRWLVSGQAVLAGVLPWALAQWDAPAWALAVACAAVLTYVVLHRQVRRVWLLAGAMVLSVAPAVLALPSWYPTMSAVIAAGCLAVVLPGLPGSTTTTSPVPHRAAAAVAWALVVMGGLTAVLAVAARDADDRAFARAQAAAAESFELTVGAGDPATDQSATDQSAVAASPALTAPSVPTTPEPNSPVVGPTPPVEDGDAAAGPAKRPPLAFLEFRRPSDGSRPVTDDRLFVGTDVSETGLQDGPGHYPTTSRPGREGNMAVAGHRTGWGAPFYRLDELRPGDRVLVGDRRGRTFVYQVDRTEVVEPEDSWVLGDDPLGTGERTLTLTTCDPPGINSKRLIVFATLVDRPSTPPAT